MKSFCAARRCPGPSVRTALLLALMVIALPRHVIVGAAEPIALSGDEVVVHVLARLSFGPRPGDIERVKEMGGIDKYIEQQLHPEQIPDPVVDQMLADFGALEMDVEELIEAYPPVAPQGGRNRATVFEKRAHVERQAASSNRQQVPPRNPSQFRRMAMQDRQKDYQIIEAKMIRALYSERQLKELMVDFWMNHFNVNFGDHPFAANFEQQVIRPHAMGKFEDLLNGVARHPGMLAYLDNWLSTAPAEVIQERLEELKPTLSDQEYLALMERMPFLEQVKGLNENYARELMELHTVGINGGYTQEDIIEVAKCLTGWTLGPAGEVSPSQFSSNAREDEGVFKFDPLLHVEGDKVVLGQTIKSGGIEEGEQVLKMLAHSPNTAYFISTKLVRRFVADDPPDEVVIAAANKFQETGGDIPEVLKTIFTSPQFVSKQHHRAKIKKPLELVASAMRAVNAQFDKNFEYSGLLAGGGRTGSLVSQMGEKVYNFETPDGNPDVAAAWINTNALLKRLEFANALVTNRFPGGGRRGPAVRSIDGLKINLDSAQALLTQMGIPQPTPEQIEQNREIVKQAIAENAAAMKKSAANQRRRPSGPPPVVPTAQAMVVSTMLGSPEFQKR